VATVKTELRPPLPLVLVGAAVVPLSRWLGWCAVVVAVVAAAASLLALALGLPRRSDRSGIEKRHTTGAG